MLVRTTSMPTPRPETVGDLAAAVEKPGAKMRLDGSALPSSSSSFSSIAGQALLERSSCANAVGIEAGDRHRRLAMTM
jgi:hypothetical protein